MQHKDPIFTPYKDLIFCSNFIHAKFLIEIGDFHPLIIGQDENGLPEVWLYIKIRDRIIPAIEKNKPIKEKNFNVVINDKSTIYQVKRKSDKEWINFMVINVSEENGVPEISFIDLTYIGLNITGDNNGLKIGKLFLGNNTIQDTKVFLKV